MSGRVKDKKSHLYEVVSERESRSRTDQAITFKSEAEARAFVEEVMSTPEGEAEILRMVAEVTRQPRMH